jgi:chromosome partitioning protein
MRIRRREKGLSEKAETGQPGDLSHDQGESRPRDPVTTLITEPAPAGSDPVVRAEPAGDNAPPGNGSAAETAPAAPDGSVGPADAGLAAPPAQNGPSTPAADVAESVHPDASTTAPAAPAAVVTEPEPAEAPAPTPVPPAKATMRAPSIGDGATELLNGSKPTARELPRVIAIANQKGGVGKTTTTVNLGAALAELDYRVLVVDLDPQGNATTGLGVEARNFELSMYDVIMREQPLEDCIEPTSVKNLFAAPATIDLAGVEIELVPAFSRELKLKRAIDTVVDDFDFVLIDCPPSLGLITVNGLAAADEVLVPIQCEYYALEGLSQLLRNVNLVSTNLNENLEVTTIVLTMYDARTRLSVDVANEVREHFAERVCRSVIPRTVRLSEAPSFGQPITVFDPASRGAVAYRELAKEVSNGAPQRSR